MMNSSDSIKVDFRNEDELLPTEAGEYNELMMNSEDFVAVACCSKDELLPTGVGISYDEQKHFALDTMWRTKKL